MTKLFAALFMALICAAPLTARAACVSPGQVVDIRGAGFGATPSGTLRLGTRAAQVLQWSSSQIRVRVPSAGLGRAGAVRVVWVRPDGSRRTLATLRRCPSVATTEYIVASDTRTRRAIRAALDGFGVQVLRRTELPELGLDLFIVRLPSPASLPQIERELRRLDNAASIALHQSFELSGGPRVYADLMLASGGTARCALPRPVKIGLIDGSIAANAEGLRGVRIAQKTFVRSARSDWDHATRLAILIAGRNVETEGYAAGAVLTVATAFGEDRRAKTETIAQGLDWLVGQNVEIITMAFAGKPDRVFSRLVSEASGRGALLIAAVGNRGGAVGAPAAFADVIGVTAVDASSRPLRTAARGKGVDLSAPGVELYSVGPDGPRYVSGTSYAAAIVAALAAHHLARGQTPEQTKRALIGTARDLGAPGRDRNFGHGLVQTPCAR